MKFGSFLIMLLILAFSTEVAASSSAYVNSKFRFKIALPAGVEITDHNPSNGYVYLKGQTCDWMVSVENYRDEKFPAFMHRTAYKDLKSKLADEIIGGCTSQNGTAECKESDIKFTPIVIGGKPGLKAYVEYKDESGTMESEILFGVDYYQTKSGSLAALVANTRTPLTKPCWDISRDISFIPEGFQVTQTSLPGESSKPYVNPLFKFSFALPKSANLGSGSVTPDPKSETMDIYFQGPCTWQTSIQSQSIGDPVMHRNAYPDLKSFLAERAYEKCNLSGAIYGGSCKRSDIHVAPINFAGRPGYAATFKFDWSGTVAYGALLGVELVKDTNGTPWNLIVHQQGGPPGSCWDIGGGFRLAPENDLKITASQTSRLRSQQEATQHREALEIYATEHIGEVFNVKSWNWTAEDIKKFSDMIFSSPPGQSRKDLVLIHFSDIDGNTFVTSQFFNNPSDCLEARTKSKTPTLTKVTLISCVDFDVDVAEMTFTRAPGGGWKLKKTRGL